jgi:succinate-acetate transporter protein
MVWMIVCFMLLLGSLRGSIPLAATFFFLFLMFLLLGVAQFKDSSKFLNQTCSLVSTNVMISARVLRGGGVIGCIASFLAFYTGAIGLHNRDTTYYDLPAMGLARPDHTDTTARY